MNEFYSKSKSYGQHQSTAKTINKKLDQYEKGPAIIKEQLQNSDDAKAKKFIFCFDEREHGTKSLIADSKELKESQGPAILVYNDGIFEPKDWENIVNIENSGKGLELEKIGGFGLGFCSNYHITDFPNVVSGDTIEMYDPLMTYLPGISKVSAPGASISISSKKISEYKDQFEPFNLFGCDILSGKYFNGTLFRFSLRKKPSEISKNIYSHKDIFDIIDKFIEESIEFILFLKHLKEIEIRHIDAKGNENILYSCKAEEVGGKKQSDIQKILKNQYDGDLSFIYQMKYTETIKGKKKEQQWIFSNILDQGDIQKKATKINSEGKFLAFGQIAYCLDKPLIGKPYCFLPFFCETMLPVHINSYFCPSQERRGLYNSTEGLKFEWNDALLTKLLPKCYLNLLEHMKLDYGFDDIIPLFPMMDSLQNQFSKLPIALYKMIFESKLFKNTKNQWVSLKDSYYLENKVKNHSTIMKFLENEKYSVVMNIPEEILKAFKASSVELNIVTPKFIRSVLKQKRNLKKEELTDILEFMLQDNDYNDFEEVYCLLLTNGEIEKVKNSKYHLYLPSKLEREVFIDSNLVIDNSGLLESLYEIIHFKVRTQLKKITFEDFANLLSDVFPKEIFGKQEIPRIKRFSNEYCSKIFERISLNLDQKHLILFPCILTTKDTLCNVNQVFFKQGDIPKTIEDVMEAFDIRFLSQTFPNSSLIFPKEELFKKFLEHSKKKNDYSTFEGKQKEFYSYVNDQLLKSQITKDDREFISSFPIFETWKSSSFKALNEIFLVKINEKDLLEGFDCFFKDQTSIIEHFIVKELSTLEAFTQYIFPLLKKTDPKEIGAKMDIIFKNYFSTLKNEESFIHGLQNIKFVPCENDKNSKIEYQCPKDCVDKSVKYLNEIFKGKYCFPINSESKFKPKSYMKELQILGMKRDLTPDCLPLVLHNKMDFQRCKEILECLDNEELISKDYEAWKTEFEKIEGSISWIPVDKEQKETIKRTKPKEFEDYLGGKFPICHKKLNSNSLMKIFGWKRIPPSDEAFKKDLFENYFYHVEKNIKPLSIDKIFEEIENLVEKGVLKDLKILHTNSSIYIESGYFKIQHLSMADSILKTPSYLQGLIKRKLINIPQKHSSKDLEELYQYTSNNEMDFQHKIDILKSIIKLLVNEKDLLKNLKLPTSLKKMKSQSEICFSDREEKFEILHIDFLPYARYFNIKPVSDEQRRSYSAERISYKFDDSTSHYSLLKTILDLGDYHYSETVRIDLNSQELIIIFDRAFEKSTIEKILFKREFKNVEVNTKKFRYEKVNNDIFYFNESKEMNMMVSSNDYTSFSISNEHFSYDVCHSFVLFSKNVSLLHKYVDGKHNMAISRSKDKIEYQNQTKKKITSNRRNVEIDGLDKKASEQWKIISQIGSDQKINSPTEWGFICHLAINEKKGDLSLYYYPNPESSIANSLSDLLDYGFKTNENKFQNIDHIQEDPINQKFLKNFISGKSHFLLVSNQDKFVELFIEHFKDIVLVLPNEMLINYIPHDNVLSKISEKMMDKIPETFYYRLWGYFTDCNKKMIDQVPKITLANTKTKSDKIFTYEYENDSDLLQFIMTEKLNKVINNVKGFEKKVYNRDEAIVYWLKQEHSDLAKHNQKRSKDMKIINEKLKTMQTIPKELNDWDLIQTTSGFHQLKEINNILYFEDEKIQKICDILRFIRALEPIIVKENVESFIYKLKNVQNLEDHLSPQLIHYLHDFILDSDQLSSTKDKKVLDVVKNLHIIPYKKEYLSFNSFDIITTNEILSNGKIPEKFKVLSIEAYQNYALIPHLNLNVIQNQSDLLDFFSKNKVNIGQEQRKQMMENMDILDILRKDNNIKFFGEDKNLKIFECYNPDKKLFQVFCNERLLNQKFKSKIQELKRYGLIMEPSFNDLINFSTFDKVEKTREACELLLDEFLKLNLNYHQKKYLEMLDIIPIYNGSNVSYVPLSNCIRESHQYLVSNFNFKTCPKEYENLLIKSEPDIEYVKKNLNYLTYEFKRSASLFLIQDIEKIYYYLDSHNESIEDSILKNGFMISKNKLYRELDKDYPPYFYTLRNDEKLLKLKNFIQEIPELPSNEVCNGILDQIEREYRRKKMTENILGIAFKCIQILIQNSSKIKYLISMDEKICKIEDLYSIDDTNIYKSIKKDEFNFLHPLFDNPDITNHVKDLKRLSQFIIVENQGNSDPKITDFTKELETILQSKQFYKILCSLIYKEYFEIKFGNTKKKQEIQEIIEEIASKLEEIKVREVEDSSVRYLDKRNKFKDITLNQKSNSLCFFEDDTLFIKSKPNPSIIYYLITVQLNDYFDNVLQDTSNLWKYLQYGDFDKDYEFYYEKLNIIGSKLNDSDKKNLKSSQEVCLNEIVEYKGFYVKVVEKTKPNELRIQGSDEVLSVKRDDLRSISYQNVLKKSVYLDILKSDDKEFIEVEKLFKKTMNAKIVKIEKITNNILLEIYQNNLKSENDQIRLFHGTRGTEPSKIYNGENGLDMRFSNNGMWGKGIYFAVNSSYSDGYAHCKNNIKQMFVCDVNVGKFYKTNSDGQIKKPPKGYDSVKGNTGGSDVFIIYENGKTYPRYLISYQ